MVTMKYWLECGALIRGDAKRAVLKRAAVLGLDASVTEDKQLLSSLYTFSFHGPAATAQRFMTELSAWQANIAAS